MPTAFLRSTLAILLAVASLSLAPAPRPAQAAGTWYVAPTGNDSNDCATPATPCATINAAIGKAAAGDTIMIGSGVYEATGAAAVDVTQNLVLSGGWNSSFGAQPGFSTVDGMALHQGVIIREGVTALLERFVIRNGTAETGGGIGNYGSLTLVETEVTGSQAPDGGGIFSSGVLTLIRSSVIRNTGGRGGGIRILQGSLELINSTLGENSAYAGANLFVQNWPRLTMASSTIGRGTAVNLGSIYIEGVYGAVKNSIFLTSVGCGNQLTSEGHNLGSFQGCLTANPTDRDLADPQLGDLKGTPAHYALAPTSPAINGGEPAGCTDFLGNAIATDGRGAPRVGRCDVGAYEAGLAMQKDVNGRFSPGGQTFFTLTVRNDEGLANLAGVAVTDTLPSGSTYISATLSATSGAAQAEGSVITWTGSLSGAIPVVIQFQTRLAPDTLGQVITNTAEASWNGFRETASASFPVSNSLRIPQVSRNYCPDFFDNFNSPSSRWYLGEDQALLAQIAAGEYRLYAKVSDIFLIAAPTCPRQSYIVEADARWAAPSTDSYGLLFGLNADWSRFYFLEVNPYFQGFRVFGYTNTAGFKLIAGPYLNSAIRPATDANHLAVRRDGNEIVVILNGAWMGRWFDYDSLDLTRPGLLVLTFDDEPVADARFDNFRITSLEYNAAALDAGRPSLAPAGPTASRPANVAWPWPTVDQIRRALENR